MIAILSNSVVGFGRFSSDDNPDLVGKLVEGSREEIEQTAAEQEARYIHVYEEVMDDYDNPEYVYVETINSVWGDEYNAGRHQE